MSEYPRKSRFATRLPGISDIGDGGKGFQHHMNLSGKFRVVTYFQSGKGKHLIFRMRKSLVPFYIRIHEKHDQGGQDGEYYQEQQTGAQACPEMHGVQLRNPCNFSATSVPQFQTGRLHGKFRRIRI
ncbi:MAG: hypothetical protein ACYDB9_07635 [Gammaproteobacteria bacterium]